MTQDLNICPKCGGPADNGHDRCVPPSAYWCSKCEEKSEMEPFGVWHQADDPDECDFFLGDVVEAVCCDRCINLYTADQLRAAKVQVLREAAGYRYIGASDAKLLHDMAELKWKVKVLREVVISWSSLIEFQYSGSKEAMTHMQICDNMGQAVLEKTK